MMNVKEKLLELGMKEKDFDRHESDLYVRGTPISEKFLDTYPFKSQVTRFIDNIEGVPWFEFPFVAMEEKIASEKQEAENLKQFLLHKNV